jgi:crotonobetainyl-CoA:carnitine CoA-transferase CaiB-like acyl-CoA transferase
VFADPQVRHLGLAAEVESPVRGTIRLLAQPIVLSRTPSRLAAPPPEAGEHTEEVLAAIGYDAAAVAGLRARGIV